MTPRLIPLEKLNSITKYPSILTYHKINPKNGSLLDEVLTPLTGDLIGTEKADGANARIIIIPFAYTPFYFLASREELLYAQDDLLYIAKEGIVDTLRPLADRLLNEIPVPLNHAIVIYLEVFGGDIGDSGKASKRYTQSQTFGYRAFDVALFPITQFEEMLTWPLTNFSGWRERGGQPFLHEDNLKIWCTQYNIPLVPRLTLTAIPTGLNDMLPWLHANLPKTLVGIDAEGPGEGIVVRSQDRKTIAKIRFEDYERTIRRMEINKLK
jgi:hypothetical protein